MYHFKQVKENQADKGKVKLVVIYNEKPGLTGVKSIVNKLSTLITKCFP